MCGYRLSEAEHRRRLELHQQGLGDAKLGAAVGISRQASFLWRIKTGLPKNERQEDGQRYVLWAQGLCDREIAETLGVSRSAIRAWRHRRGLDANPDKSIHISEEEDDRRLADYLAGYTDRELSVRWNKCLMTVNTWRRKKGLPPNGGSPKGGPSLSDEEHLRRLADWDAGYTPKELAERWGRTVNGVRGWQYRLGLLRRDVVN